MMDLERLVALFESLGRFRVDYAVFGAVALGLHGLPRATADLDLFIAPEPGNVERLKAALLAVYDDPSIHEISAEDLCGDYPAVRYEPPDGFGLDVLTRLGDAFRYEDLEIEERVFENVAVRVVSARTLWKLKKDTIRPADRIDALAIADHFGFED